MQVSIFNVRITSAIFQTIPKQTHSLLHSSSTPILQPLPCTPMSPALTHPVHLGTDWRFTNWLRVGKLDYSHLLHPCCGTLLSSGSRCWAPVSLRGADVSPQNCSNHDSQNGAESCLASLFMSMCKTPSKHSMCFFSNSFCLFKLTIKLLWHLSSSCAQDTMPRSASGDSRAAVGCSGTCQGSDMLPWVGYRGSKQDSVLEAFTSSERLQHSCTWAMDCFFFWSSMTLI